MSSVNIPCPTCQKENPYSARFCTSCGNSLAQASDTPYAPPGQHQAPSMASDYIYAGFWKRFVAYIIDVIIFTAIFIITIIVLGTGTANSGMNATAFLVGIGVNFLYLIVWWLYFALLESSSGQATLGKRVLGIKVTDMHGQQLSFMHAAGRQLSGIVTQFTFLIGYLMAAFTGKKQALHDMIASAVVVNKHFSPQQIQTVNQNPPPGMSVAAVIGVVCLVLIIPVGGIIAAIALPAYQDYIVRVKVSEGLVQASTAKTAMVEYAEETGYWPVSFEQIQIDTNQMRNENFYVQIDNNGTLVIQFNQPESVAGERIYLTPELTNTGNYDWHCDGSEIENRYLPPSCQ